MTAVGARVAAALRHELVALAGLALSSSLALRWLFFRASRWLWSFARPVGSREIAPWYRWQMTDRDGAEPHALVAAVLGAWLVVAAGMALFRRLGPRARTVASLSLLALAGVFAVPLEAPMAAVAASRGTAWLVAGGALAAALLLGRAGRTSNRIPTVLAVVLLPICLVQTTLPSLDDLGSITAPALRLAQGARVRDVYFQYDLLPSLLALGWRALGAASTTFTLVGAASYYAAFLGLYALARRLFARPWLAAPLLVSVVVVRLYGCMIDASSTPQVTSMRLDMWLPVLAVAFVAGLRHWGVGLTLGALFILAPSLGTLYLGAYAIAIAADLIGQRRGTPAASLAPLARDLVATARASAPAWAGIALGVVVSRLVFGSIGSGSVAFMRAYGMGMLRIGTASFYWWLLALTGAVGWLALATRAARPARQGESAIFAVALMAVSSVYFFGRSHEHNLVNLAAPFLFCAFLAVDLALDLAPPEGAPGARLPRGLLTMSPFIILVFCAFQYSGRVVAKLEAQWAIVARGQAVPRAWPGDDLSGIACDEILRAAPDRRVLFLSRHDHWLYERCGLAPIGFFQPIALSFVEDRLLADLNRLLADGYKIVVPTHQSDWSNLVGEFLPALGNPTRVTTPHYLIFRR